ncbi:hypothetical protein P3480_25735, partial [Vibrio parahaemolyticus]|nr:hypothetical protein [Vibrio parahaemolyticus]
NISPTVAHNVGLPFSFDIAISISKTEFTLKSKIHIIPLTCSAIYQSGLFCCELQSVGDISRRDVCLLSNIIELDGTQLMVLNAPKNTFEKPNSNVCSQKS